MEKNVSAAYFQTRALAKEFADLHNGTIERCPESESRNGYFKFVVYTENRISPKRFWKADFTLRKS